MMPAGRPRGGGGNGRRAGWWKDYAAKPGHKEHRTEYMRGYRERQRQALLQLWKPAAELPPDDLTVLLVCEVEEGERVWQGWHDKDGWFTMDGSPVDVTHWMPIPPPPGDGGGPAK